LFLAIKQLVLGLKQVVPGSRTIVGTTCSKDRKTIGTSRIMGKK
jgi:hypothetical protein